MTTTDSPRTTGRKTLGTSVSRCRTTMQMEAVECGAASLRMVLNHFGRDVPLGELREATGVSRDGSSARAILRAARGYGLDAQGVSVTAAGLPALPGPVIAHWDDNHFLVVEGVHRGRWLLNDPAKGRRQATAEEFERSFRNLALTFQPTAEFQRHHESGRDYLARLLRPLRGSWPAVALGLITGLLAVVPTLVTAFIAGIFLTQVLGARDTSLLAGIVIIVLVMAAAETVLGILQRLVFLRLHSKLLIKMESAFLQRLLRLPAAFFTERTPGQLISRMRLNGAIAGLLSGSVATTVVEVLTSVIYGAVLLILQPMLALVVLAVAAGNVLILWATTNLRVNRAQQAVQQSTLLAGRGMYGLDTIESIKARGGEDEFFASWSQAQTAVLNSRQRFGVPRALIGTTKSVLRMLESLTVFVLGGLLVLDGQLTVAALVTFTMITRKFLRPVAGLSRIGGRLQTTRALLDQLSDVTDAPVDPETERRAETTEIRRLSGEVEFRDVTFGYAANEPPLLQGLSFFVPAGGRVALVGASGSGRSTVGNLLVGVQSPWSGTILLDGVDRREWPRAVLAASVGKVDQDIVLFDATVRENLRLWDEAVPDTDIVRAAQDADIHGAIMARRGGYDARIAEGGRNLSGGQAQRLEIARSLVANPSVLVLDEATSDLDAVSERRIDQGLRRRGITCVLIAHRLSTIRDCDWILVLNRGVVVQQGTHDDLVAVPGDYRDLVSAG